MHKVTKSTGLAAAAIAGSLILTGCASPPGSKSPTINPYVIETNDPSIPLLEIAKEIQLYQAEIASIERANAKVKPTDQHYRDGSAPQLERYISIEEGWTGPIGPLVKLVSSLTDVEVLISGDKPPVDIIVSVDTRYRRAIDILRDAGNAAGSRADIEIKMLPNEPTMMVLHYYD